MPVYVATVANRSILAVYVATVANRSILALYADCDSDAARRVSDPLLRDDLMALATSGVPLWNGLGDILVRRAQSGEETRWANSHARAIQRGNIDGEDRSWVAFLVPLDT